MSAAGVPRLRWIGRLTVGLIVGLTVLAVSLDARPGSDGRAPWEARLVAVAAIDLVWLLELTGVSLPRPLFVAAVGLPVAWLNVAEDGAVSILFLLLAVGWAAYTASESASRAGLGIGLGAALSYLINVDPEGWLAFSTGLVLTWLFVCGLLRQQQLRVEQERLVAELRAAQADLARQAQASERRRIAREIHDVAAHTLSVTMLQLTGVRLLLQRTGGDARAVEALAEAERLGRQGLDDVRRTVGLLGDGPAEAASAPLPGGGDVERLVAEYHAVGLDVVLESRGDRTRLPAAAGLALYRIAQEALANVAKHAPGALVKIQLDIDRRVRLRVHNTAGRPGAPIIRSEGGSGLGLIGMRERAELLGGSVVAGPDGGGWVVDCSLPLATSQAANERAKEAELT